MRDLLFPSSPVSTGGLRASARAAAAAFVLEVRSIARMYDEAVAEQREFVHGEVACVLHLSPMTALARVEQALALVAQPRLLAALEHGQLHVPHALAVLAEIRHLEGPHAAAVLEDVLGHDRGDVDAEPVWTPGELRSAVKKAVEAIDPQAARKRHEQAKKTADVRSRPTVDGMAQIVVDCTATEAATAMAAVNGRAAAMPFDDPGLTVGQKRVAALLHALGCDRVRVQAVLECPVERQVDLNAAAGAGVWTVDVRMPVAVALGLSDHPGVLAGYGPIGAGQARALLPAADLVRACVDAETGEVLTVDPPVRAKTWTAGDPSKARALRKALLSMATSGGTIPDLGTPGYVPTEALGRLVDLRDVTSVFPGDSTSARRCDRDHRLPYPLGRTDEGNLQNTARRWHRAKHNGWHTSKLPDGTIRWTSPAGRSYDRTPKRTRPPNIPDGTSLPPLPD